MKKATRLCVVLAALCLLSACGVEQSPALEPAPPAQNTAKVITPEEGAAILEEMLGTEDEITGNLMSYGYEGALTLEDVDYYNYRVSWLVDGSHLSYLTNYLVSTNGTILKEYTTPPSPETVRAMADSLLAAMAAQPGYGTFADWGGMVAFSPYGTVDPKANLVFDSADLAALDGDETVYTWGTWDGSGGAIEMTAEAYWNRFIWDADWTAATVTVNGVAQNGSSPDNVAEAYPGASWVEYHFSGLDSQYGGADWRSLKLVFDESLSLIAVVHSEAAL